MVEGEGFEPSKAEPSDLQSDPFSHSGTPPIKWCRREDLNPQPTDYKSVALPVELHRHGDPYGIRTRVAAVKGRCLRPLDQGAFIEDMLIIANNLVKSQEGFR